VANEPPHQPREGNVVPNGHDGHDGGRRDVPTNRRC
jgi:hypothetical protein